MATIKEAAFRDAQGQTVGTGPFHDISAIPEAFEIQDEGFLDTEGHFLTRGEASALCGGSKDHQLQSEEVDLCKNLKEYRFDGPVQSDTTQHLIKVFHGDKPVGSMTFSSAPHSDPDHPFHGFHQIGAVDVLPAHRGHGIYGRMLQLASTFVKKQMKSKGLVSASDTRSEAATAAWNRLAAKKPVKRQPGAEGEDFFLSEQETDQIHLDHEFKIMLRRWLEKRTKMAVEESELEPFDLDKAEKGLADFRAATSNLESGPSDLVHDVARQMAGYDAEYSPEFAAARFLAGGVPAPAESIRTALILYDNDFELAALRAYGLPRNDKYRDMLRATLLMLKRLTPGTLAKSDIQPAAIPRDIRAATPDAEKTAESVRRAQAAGAVHTVNLDPKAKHSKGTAIAIEPETNEHWLLKPGSGKLSPSAGVQEELATQSQREVAFFKIAQACGVGEFYPHADLLLMDGSQVAAMKLLGSDYKGLDKVRQAEGLDTVRLFSQYLGDGSLFKWAAMDWIMGNPDRHANNLMISEDHSDLKLIDHGSAFAGPSFDPAHDPKSFTPFYLRAWTARNWSEMSDEERLDEMPRLNSQMADEFSKWLADINEAEITQILGSYGLNPHPTMDRLKALKSAENPAEQLMENWAGLNT